MVEKSVGYHTYYIYTAAKPNVSFVLSEGTVFHNKVFLASLMPIIMLFTSNPEDLLNHYPVGSFLHPSPKYFWVRKTICSILLSFLIPSSVANPYCLIPSWTCLVLSIYIYTQREKYTHTYIKYKILRALPVFQ